MDRARRSTSTAVDYIESLLFYILRLSNFCDLHPSTAAGRRMAIDFFLLFLLPKTRRGSDRVELKTNKEAVRWGSDTFIGLVL